MKNFVVNIHSLVSKLKQIRFREFIVTVPHELKEQFDQMQLKNSIYRLKLLAVIVIFFNVLNEIISFLRADEINLILFHEIYLVDLCYFFATLLFFLFIRYFSKKGRSSVLLFLCYLFMVTNFVLSAYAMLYAETILILQTFVIGAFVYAFVPDFKPKIFVSALVLWYLAVACLLAYNGYFAFWGPQGGPQAFALNIFLLALVIRLVLYYGKVKGFINTYRISALNEKLEALSITDELTKLNNRRSFLNYMDMVWKQSRRLQLPVNVLMIDVDYFKKYNDSLGHLEGDKALVAIAQCMKNQVKRETDFVARFGGEEFVCLVPFLEKDKALDFAKDLVQKIEAMEIPHPMSEHSKYVTVSIGMASTIPDDCNSQTQLLDEADKALYMAKESGRNRAVMN
jgi:diguanylate cyclase (GGDEF)-like protein